MFASATQGGHNKSNLKFTWCPFAGITQKVTFPDDSLPISLVGAAGHMVFGAAIDLDSY